MDINRINYETFFLLYVDRELNTADRAAVENFLKENPDLQKEFRQLQNTVQHPPEIIFEQKESLYRQEKRRILPVYWARIAATIALVMAGSWFMTTVLKNPDKEITGKNEHVAAGETGKKSEAKTERLNSTTRDEAKKDGQDLSQANGKINPANNNQSKHIPENPVESSTSGMVANQAKNRKHSNQVQQDLKTGQSVATGEGQISSLTEENAVVAVQKPGNTIALQTPEAMNKAGVPLNVSKPGSIETPVLIVGVKSPGTFAENSSITEPDLQTDNAISVVALNDRNKAIAGFFKKLIKRAPADETANNSKKLRVSIFQFSY